VSSDELEGLRRAESQRQVLMCLIETGEPMASKDIAERLEITVNAVNIALFQLNKKHLVDRVSRGIYRYQMGPILLTLLKEYFNR
jgi:predicted ArsR family transcriptional regulator